jgi:hypothetical protein
MSRVIRTSFRIYSRGSGRPGRRYRRHLNANSGTQTVTEGTDAMVRLATIGPDGPTGGFFDRNGTVPG